MVGEGAADDHRVAGPDATGPEIDARRHDSDPRRGNRQPVAPAPLDHLRVAGHDCHAGLLGRGRHPRDDSHELGDRQALFEDEGGREIERHRPAHRQIVDRAVDGELADRAAGKLERPHDEGIGRESEPAAGGVAGQIEDGRVAEPLEHRVAEGRQEEMLDQVAESAPAAAMTDHDLRPIPQRGRAGEAGELSLGGVGHQVRPALK